MDPINRAGQDRDLFCLTCGYNLRGLPGDPIRCPECGNQNGLDELSVSADAIARSLRKLETGAAICGAAAATVLFWMLPMMLAANYPRVGAAPRYVSWFIGFVTALCVGFAAVGARMFRTSCGDAPNWSGALLKFTALSCVVAGLGLGAIVAVFAGIAAAAWGSEWLQVLLCLVGAVTGFVGARWTYGRAKRVIHALQRKCAV